MRRVALLLLAGCAPELDQRLSIVDAPRILAVIAEPAEAAPGAAVHYQLIAGGPDGPLAADATAWAYCTAPKPPTEDNAVAAGCLGDDPADVVAIATGATIDATLPIDACQRFGPDTPPGGFRPRDPDATGGYYQPIRATLDDQLAFGLHRLRCNLDDAPPDVAREFAERYRANLNPVPPVLVATDDASDLTDPIAAGATVALAAAWIDADSETFLGYDLDRQILVDRREAMRVSWFATAGHFAVDVTGNPEPASGSPPILSSRNRWTVPDAPGAVTVWLVLRDSRGGAAVATFPVTVE